MASAQQHFIDHAACLYGPDAVLASGRCSQREWAAASAVRAVPEGLRPPAVGTPHTVWSQKWWQANVDPQQAELWRGLGLEMPRVRHVMPVSTLWKDASHSERCAMLLASLPLFPLHRGASGEPGAPLVMHEGAKKALFAARGEPIQPPSYALSPAGAIGRNLASACSPEDTLGMCPNGLANDTFQASEAAAHPHPLLMPLWSAAAQSVALRHQQAADAPTVDDVQLHVVPVRQAGKPLRMLSHVKQAMGVDTSKLAQMRCEKCTHWVSPDGGRWSTRRKHRDWLPVQAEPLHPMQAPLGNAGSATSVPERAWWVPSGGVLFKRVVSGRTVPARAFLGVKPDPPQRFARPLCWLQGKAHESAMLQAGLAQASQQKLGVVRCAPGDFVMLVWEAGASGVQCLPLPLFGVHVVQVTGQPPPSHSGYRIPRRGGDSGVDVPDSLVSSVTNAAGDTVRVAALPQPPSEALPLPSIQALQAWCTDAPASRMATCIGHVWLPVPPQHHPGFL